MELNTARSGRERGQVLVLFTLMLGVLLGFVAMSVDVGMILYRRDDLQKAADAAALAGVQELPSSPGTAVTKSMEWAQKNGYTAADGATITVNTPYNGDPTSVEVVINVDEPFLFARALGLDSTDVQARAVASAQPPKDYAIFAHAGACEADALNIQGSTSNIDGDIHTNSELKVNSDLYVDGSVNYVCDADVSGSNTFTEGTYQVGREIDWPIMYAYSDFPCTFTYTGAKMKIGNGTPQYFVNDNPGTGTLKPGVYCSEGEIDVSASITGNVTFVARERISLSCSTCDLTAYWNDVVLFSELDGKGAISLSVSKFYFQGIILAPYGEISANGSGFFSDAGTFLGESVSISASDINITALLKGEDGPPKLVQ